MSLRGFLAEFGATWPSEGSWKSFWARNLRLPGLVFCLGLATALALGLLLVKAGPSPFQLFWGAPSSCEVQGATKTGVLLPWCPLVLSYFF